MYGTMQRRTSVEAESRENFILKLISSYHSEIIRILTQPESRLFLQTTFGKNLNSSVYLVNFTFFPLPFCYCDAAVLSSR